MYFYLLYFVGHLLIFWLLLVQILKINNQELLRKNSRLLFLTFAFGKSGKSIVCLALRSINNLTNYLYIIVIYYTIIIYYSNRTGINYHHDSLRYRKRKQIGCFNLKKSEKCAI